MAEKTTGIYRLITIPAFYRSFQDILGGVSARASLKRDFFPDLHGLTVLEVGCGPGTWFEEVKDCEHYTGIDWNGEHIAQANAAYGSNKARFIEGDIVTDVGKDGEKFDRIFAFGILHHIDDGGVKNLMAIIRQRLKEGGQFISIDPVYHEGQHFLARWMKNRDSGKNIRTQMGYEALIQPELGQCEAVTVTDRLRIPYSHCIITASKNSL